MKLDSRQLTRNVDRGAESELSQASVSSVFGSPLLTPDEAAAWLRVTKGHPARLRVVGGGPAFIKLSRRCVVYRLQDLQACVAARIRRSTSDQGG
jgi:hypothetical protein